MEEGPGFSTLLWDFVGGTPRVNRLRNPAQVPAETELSRSMSKELARRGFKFVGPTIVYAFMQAVGIVNDHLLSCHRHPEFGRRRLRSPTRACVDPERTR
jgi:DNA-3-methyladenine glycosylase I